MSDQTENQCSDFSDRLLDVMLPVWFIISPILIIVLGVLLAVSNCNNEELEASNEEQATEISELATEKAAAEKKLTARNKNLAEIQASAVRQNQEAEAEFKALTQAYEVVPGWLKRVDFTAFPALPQIEARGYELVTLSTYQKSDDQLEVYLSETKDSLSLPITWPNLATAFLREGNRYGIPLYGSLDDLGIKILAVEGSYAGDVPAYGPTLVKALVTAAENQVTVNSIGFAFYNAPTDELIGILPKEKATIAISGLWKASVVSFAVLEKAVAEFDRADSRGELSYFCDENKSSHFQGWLLRRWISAGRGQAGADRISFYRTWIALAAVKYGLDDGQKMLAEAVTGLERATTLDPAQRDWLLTFKVDPIVKTVS